MIEEIKAIANEAKNKLNAKISLNESQYQSVPIHEVLKLYKDLLQLIEIAEEQQATTGLLLLSRQLINGCEKLNALQLAIHYLMVLKYQRHSNYGFIKTETIFSNDRRQDQHSIVTNLDILRCITQAIIDMLFVFQFSMTAFALPVAIILAGTIMIPALYYMAGITLLCGLSHCFDEPYSMTCLYDGMANLEFSLSMGTLFMGFTGLMWEISLLLLAISNTAALPFLAPIAAGTFCVLLLSYALWRHSEVLEKKYENITNAVIYSDTFRNNRLDRSNLNNFFKYNEQEASFKNELSQINVDTLAPTL